MGKKSKPTKRLLLVSGSMLAVFAVVFYAGIVANKKTSEQAPSATVSAPEGTNQSGNTPALSQSSTEQQLTYLIEEEKLAHDVYTVMYDIYGARVFGNILESEQSHQDRVLALLKARNIPDPRTSEVGKFNNQELQSLYDKLVAQGRQSEVEAFRAGVAIEEKDIADISKQLSTASDKDVIDTLELLRGGSENHLRAFNRQL